MSIEFQFLIGPETVAAEAQMPVEQRVPWPLDSVIMYAFDGDKLVGRMGLMSIKMIEGTWAAPDASPTLAYRMMKQMDAMQIYLGSTSSFAMVHDIQPEIAGYLERVGFQRFPVTLYQKMLEMKKEEAA